MNELLLKIQDLEYTVAELKKEIRRIKSAIKKVEKIGLVPPSEILFKKAASTLGVVPLKPFISTGSG